MRLRSDEQLVALFREGSEEAFGVIHDRYRQRLFAYTRQMLAGSRQDAEDALQDVFLRAYGALRANERPVSLRAWLYRVAHNRCIDQLRRPVPPHADLFDVSRSPLHDPLAETERREDLRRLVQDVRRLPQAQRSALLMRELEGLSYDELSTALETTVPAVKSLLVRARIGLVEAAEARDTACVEIRRQLLVAYDKGVRASGQARRHMRECDGCREYRTNLRGVQRSFASLGAPIGAGPLSLLAKLGLGGSAAGSGAAGGAAAGGGGAAGICAAGGGVVAAGKVVVVVCSVAVVTAGAASEVQQHVSPPKATAARHAAPAARTATMHSPAAVVGAAARAHVQPSAGALPVRSVALVHRRHRHHHAVVQDLAPVRDTLPQDAPVIPTEAPPADSRIDSGVTGGAVAPDEPAATDQSTSTAQPSDSSGSSGSSTTTTPLGVINPPPPSSGSTASGSGSGTQDSTQQQSSSSSSSDPSSPNSPDHSPRA